MFTGAGAYGYGGAYGVPPVGTKAAPMKNISYDTSSKDPTMMRARVFVGNINTNVVSREELIQLFQAYGHLIGCTVFKGYAFMQFSNMAEADLAVSALNGYNWNGSVLDVKLAVTGMKTNPTYDSNMGTVKRPSAGGSMNFPAFTRGGGASEATKRAKYESLTINSGDFQRNEMPDVLICGECRHVFSDIELFVEHRKKPCKRASVKAQDEPDLLKCFTCDAEYDSSWGLINHLSETHKLSLYKETAAKNGTESEAKEEM